MQRIKNEFNELAAQMGFRNPLIINFGTTNSVTRVRMRHLILSADGVTFVYKYGEYTYEQLTVMACEEILRIQENRRAQ